MTVLEAMTVASRGGISSDAVSRRIDRIEVVFHDPNLVTNAGLLVLVSGGLGRSNGCEHLIEPAARPSRGQVIDVVTGLDDLPIAYPHDERHGRRCLGRVARTRRSCTHGESARRDRTGGAACAGQDRLTTTRDWVGEVVHSSR